MEQDFGVMAGAWLHVTSEFGVDPLGKGLLYFLYSITPVSHRAGVLGFVSKHGESWSSEELPTYDTRGTWGRLGTYSG